MTKLEILAAAWRHLDELCNVLQAESEPPTAAADETWLALDDLVAARIYLSDVEDRLRRLADENGGNE